MLRLGYTLQILQIAVVTSQLLRSFIPLMRATKTFCRKNVNTWWVEYSLFFQGKLMRTRLLFGIRQTGASPLSELMLVSSILFVCQAMATGLCMKWELDLESARIKPSQNKTRSFENMVVSYFQWIRPHCKVERFYRTSTDEKRMQTVLKALVHTATVFLKLRDAIINIVRVKKLFHPSLNQKINDALKERTRWTTTTEHTRKSI